MRRTDKRAQIMQAAERLFTRRRFHEITLDDVARAAKVGKGTIYRYFKNKEDLFFQTAASGFGDLEDLLHRTVPREADFREQLLVACGEITDFFGRRRQLFRMMQAEAGRMRWCNGEFRKQWHAGRKRLTEAVAEIIHRGVNEGAVRKDISSEVLARILLGMLRTRARDLGDLPDSDRSHEMIIDVFCNGATLRRRAARTRKKATATAK